MLHLCLKSLAGIALVLAMFSNAHGVTVYSESVNGDLSNNGLNPTVLTLGVGSNEILGSTGQLAGVSDRDYFTFTVPSNLKVTQIIEEAGTQAGGGQSLGFFAVQSGTQVTLPTNTATAAGLLGWIHYGPTATDINILPAMGIPANGSSGFIPPLGPGSYAFWLQDTSAGTFNYGLNVVLAPIPEPSAGALIITGFFALCWFFRRRNN
jgi:hypothetical protein